jgi:hypothetical protein
MEQSPATENTNHLQADHVANNERWTSSNVAAIILLVFICSILVWNAYHPEDIFLSDLKYEAVLVEQIEPQNDTSAGGNTITIHKTYYPKGVGVHANSEIQIRFIPNNYKFFITEIGMDNQAGDDPTASVCFFIYSDGTLLYESPVMTPKMAPRFVRVPIEGRNSLTLKVTDAGDGKAADLANWAMARFTYR